MKGPPFAKILPVWFCIDPALNPVSATCWLKGYRLGNGNFWIFFRKLNAAITDEEWRIQKPSTWQLGSGFISKRDYCFVPKTQAKPRLFKELLHYYRNHLLSESELGTKPLAHWHTLRARSPHSQGGLQSPSGQKQTQKVSGVERTPTRQDQRCVARRTATNSPARQMEFQKISHRDRPGAT